VDRPEPGTPTGPAPANGVCGDDTVIYYQCPLQRDPSMLASSPKSPRPSGSDGQTPKHLSASQAEFYARTKADYSPLTPTSPTISLSITSTTTMTSASSQIYDPNAALYAPSKQESAAANHSAPIAVPYQLLDQGLDQREGVEASANGLDNTSSSPRRHADVDPQSNYRHQQRQLSADLRLLGTSPEAKEWLKQKPTRSTSHMIHQYNYHLQQYYQPPGGGSGGVKPINGFAHSVSTYSQSPTRPTANIDFNISSSQKVWPNSITAAATAIASSDDSTVQPDVERTREGVCGGLEPSTLSPGVSMDQVHQHFDGHFHGNGHSIPYPPPLQNPPSQSQRKEVRIGRLVMSRSKLNLPSVSSATSVASIHSGNSWMED
ncbi:hypothetical protein BGZ99_009875, partial [Dissophora globulifera]